MSSISAGDVIKTVMAIGLLYGCWWVLKRVFIALNLLLRPTRKRGGAMLGSALKAPVASVAKALDQVGLGAVNVAANAALAANKKVDDYIDAAVDAEVTRISKSKSKARVEPEL